MTAEPASARLAEAADVIAAEAGRLLRVADAPERYLGYARDIAAAAAHLQNVLRAPPPSVAEICLLVVARQARAMLLPRAEDRRVLLAPVAGDPAPVRADARAVLQILSNLLANAVKFSAEGGRVTIAVTDTPAVEIGDTGPGIAAADRERAFEAFRQLDDHREGIGLGLPISRRLARDMGGELMLIPSAIGACFRLTLPAV